MNPSGKEGPGFVALTAHLVCHTSMYHLHLKASLAPCEDGCVSGNAEGCAESAVSVGRFGEGVAEKVRAHLRCDENVESVGAVCRGPLFHNEQQRPESHVAVDENGNESL